MRRSGAWMVAVMLTAAVLLPSAALATNGYFSHGVGMKSKGMGGVGVALPVDALSAGVNPASSIHLGDRFDVGLDWFRPDRGSEISGSGAPVNAVYDANDTEYFFVPEVGMTKSLNDRVAFGLAVYGNGGMNTSYTTPVGLFGSTNAGVDLSQLFIVPSVAVRVSDGHALGLGVNVAWQRFKADGLENFDDASYTSTPGKVTGNDYDSSTGFGVTVGWIGRVGCAVTMGATYRSRTFMGEFEDYAGLFAEEGTFDIPSSFSAGIAVTPDSRSTVAVDVSYIMYSDVNSIANPLLPNLGEAQLGTEDGAGFGWEDVTVVKIGAEYDLTDAFTARVGYNYGGQPIPESETLFNILAPGVVEQHVTLGGTWRLNESMELTFAYMHAFEKTVEGEESIPMDFGGGEADLTMSQDTFGVSFGMVY
ncbi:MAG: outer membrane protein transport protein [Candidatus Eisenbacteria bacterium]|nr:outer membrane protein transport protein [Candidatus Eisenbacteria bacterium]